MKIARYNLGKLEVMNKNNIKEMLFLWINLKKI